MLRGGGNAAREGKQTHPGKKSGSDPPLRAELMGTLPRGRALAPRGVAPPALELGKLSGLETSARGGGRPIARRPVSPPAPQTRKSARSEPAAT